MICISLIELQTVGLWLCCGRPFPTASGGPPLLFHLVLGRSVLGWWGLGPVSNAELNKMLMGILWNMLWCTTGVVGCALEALRLWICLPDSFTSRAPFPLALADYVGRSLALSGSIFLTPVLTCTVSLLLGNGRTSVPYWNLAFRALLCLLFSLCSWIISSWYVHDGVSDIGASLVFWLHALGCVLSLPSGSAWEWWVILIDR